MSRSTPGPVRVVFELRQDGSVTRIERDIVGNYYWVAPDDEALLDGILDALSSLVAAKTGHPLVFRRGEAES